MRTIILSFLIIITGCTFTQSGKTSQQTSKNVPVVIACRASGDLDLLVLSPLTDPSDTKEIDRVVLSVPTSPRKEYKSYWDGASIFFGSDSDGGCWTQFGRLHMHSMLFPNIPDSVSILCFKQDGEHWASVDIDDNILYEEIQGKATAIAQIEYSRPYKSEIGEERTTDMTKRLGKDEKWCFQTDDGKVYLQDSVGKIIQIGWAGWRVVTPSNGNKLLVIMTKGMGKNAKWQGKHNGKLYIEK